MSDPGSPIGADSVVLNVNIQEALKAVKQLQEQIKVLRENLKTGLNVNDEGLKGVLGTIRAALKDQAALTKAIQLSQVEIKRQAAEIDKRISQEIEGTRRVESENAKRMAQEIEGLRRVQVQNAERFSQELEGERRVYAQNSERMAQEIEGLRRVQAQNAERFAQELEGDRRVQAMNAERLAQETEGVRRVQAQNAERFAQEIQGELRVRAINAERIAQELEGDRRVQAMQAAAAKAQAAAQRETNAPSRLFASQAARLVNYAVLGSALGGAYEVVNQIVKLDEALHNLQGITQTSSAGMVVLRQRILDVSSASKFSAVDVANAATILGQAGLSAQQIGDALQHVVTFAQASGSTLDQSVQLMTSAMGAFGLQATELGHVSDTFTSALNNSKLNIDQLTTAFQYSAPSAAELGVTYKELTATMALMANAGIKSGSMIGTGIRQIINQLAAPSTKFQNVLAGLGLSMDDVDVKSQGLLGVVEKLKSAGFGATEAFQAFGTRGAGAFIALTNQIGGANEMLMSLNHAGSAAKAAETQMKSLANTARETGSKFISLASDAFNPFLLTTTGMIGGIGKLIDVLHVLMPVITTIATGLTVLALVQGARYVMGLGLMSTATRALSASMAILRTEGIVALLASFGPVGWIVAGITAAIVTLGIAYRNHAEETQKAAAAMETANGKYQAAKDAVAAVDQEIQNLSNRQKMLGDGTTALASQTAYLGERFSNLGLDVSRLGGSYNSLYQAMLRVKGVAASNMTQALGQTYTTAQASLALSRENLGHYIGGSLTNAAQNAVGANVPGALQSTFQLRTGINDPAVNAFFSALKDGSLTMAKLNAAQDALNLKTGNTSTAFVQLKDLVNKTKDAYGEHATQVKANSRLEAELRAQAARSTPQISGLFNNIEQTVNNMKNNLPKQGFGDSINYREQTLPKINQINGYINDQIKYLDYMAKTHPQIAMAYKEEADKLKQMRGSIGATAAKIGEAAKAAQTNVDASEEIAIKRSLQVLQMKQGAAKSEGEAAAIGGQISAGVNKLFAMHIKSVMDGMAIRPDAYTINGPTADQPVVFKSNKVTGDAKLKAEAAILAEVNAMDVYTTRSDIRTEKIGDAAAKKAHSAAIKAMNIETRADESDIADDARNAIHALDLSIQTHLRNITTLKDKLDEYSSFTSVQAIFKQIQDELFAWYAEQVQKLQMEQQKILDTNAKIQSDKHLSDDQLRLDPGYKKPMTQDEVAQSLTDIWTQYQDKQIGALKENTDALKSTTRLPTNMNDVMQTISNALRDPRSFSKDWASVDQTALLLQDVFTGMITEFRTSFSDMLLSLEEGTKSIGQSLMDFGHGMFEAALKGINANLTQKTLDFAAQHLLPDGFGDMFKDPQQANTDATKGNTEQLMILNQRLAAGGIGGGGGGIPGVGSGSGSGDFLNDRLNADPSGMEGQSLWGGGAGGAGADSGGFFSSISSFFSNLFTQISGFLAPLMSQMGSIFSSILPMIMSIFNQGGLVHRATGGLIPGPITTRDTVVAPVPTGSFIMRKTATDNIGANNLAMLNQIAAKSASRKASRMTMAALTSGEFSLTPEAVSMVGAKTLNRWNFDGGIKSRVTSAADQIMTQIHTHNLNTQHPHFGLGGLAGDVFGTTDHRAMGMPPITSVNGKLAKSDEKPHQTNVYIMKGDEPPPMGKNDVIAAWTDDMLTGGVTKKLVKSVMAGA